MQASVETTPYQHVARFFFFYTVEQNVYRLSLRGIGILTSFVAPGVVKRQEEREKEDSRILEKALAHLAVEHRERLSDLEGKLKGDEKKKKDAFEQERVRQNASMVHVCLQRQAGKHRVFVNVAACTAAEITPAASGGGRCFCFAPDEDVVL